MSWRAYLFTISSIVIISLGLIGFTHHILPWWHNYLMVRTINTCEKELPATLAQRPTPTKLPSQIPAAFTLTYYHHGGMLPRYTEITFGTTTFKLEEVDNQQKKRFVTDPLSPPSRIALYNLVRALAFDQVATEKNSEPVHDAAGQSISFVTTSGTQRISLDATTYLAEAWIPEWQILTGCIARVANLYH